MLRASAASAHAVEHRPRKRALERGNGIEESESQPARSGKQRMGARESVDQPVRHRHAGPAIGAAAAAGIGYLVLRNHDHATVSGCVQSAESMDTLLDSKQNSYTLINTKSVPLKAGERVELRGKKVQRNSGPAFEVHGLVKDYGQCQQ
jgi:hypothetical protein